MNSLPEVPIYKKAAWISDKKRNFGAQCLEHLVAHHSPEKPSVLEIGPVDSMFPDVSYIDAAPIKSFQEHNPHIPCAAIGPEDLTREQIRDLLGEVPWVQGMYGEGGFYNPQEVSEVLGEPPSIIYASHVIENSRGGPFSCYRIFEKAAEELPDDGLLVVDNAFGAYNRVARQKWPHSERMMLKSVYKHLTTVTRDFWNPSLMTKIRQAIFVFQRAPSSATVEEIKSHTQEVVRGLVTRKKIDQKK